MLRSPAGEVSAPRFALFVAAGFVALHLFLAFAIRLYIDHDEIQYGQFAVLILDGLWHHVQWVRPNGREGFALFFGPLVTPFFALLGANLLTLRIAHVVFAGAWAAAWGSVARRLAPNLPVWAVAGLFILPAPFISRYSTSPVAMSTHLGVSTAHGLAVLLLLSARDARGVRRWRSLVGAGLVAGFGAYGGLLMAVLLPGVVFGAMMIAGPSGIGAVLLGMSPGLALAFLQNNPLVALDVPEYVGTHLDLWSPFEFLRYAPGYPPPESWGGNYLPTGLGYFGFIAAVYVLGRRARPAPTEPMLAALLVSVACLLVSFVPGQHHTPFDRSGLQWDSLRYVAPVLPVAAIVVLVSCSRIAASRRRLATMFVGLLLVAHAAGFASHVSWQRLSNEKISEAWIRSWLRFDPAKFPLPALPDSARHDSYALREGMTAFVADQADAQKLGMRAQSLGLEGRALEEFWRGVGRARVLWRTNDQIGDITHTSSLPADVVEAIWQGIGMEAHLCDFEHRTEGLDRFLPSTPAERAAFAWGWTRVCTDDAHLPSLLPDLSIDRPLGRRVRWDLDLSTPDAPPVTDEDLQHIVFKQWVP